MSHRKARGADLDTVHRADRLDKALAAPGRLLLLAPSYAHAVRWAGERKLAPLRWALARDTAAIRTVNPRGGYAVACTPATEIPDYARLLAELARRGVTVVEGWWFQ